LPVGEGKKKPQGPKVPDGQLYTKDKDDEISQDSTSQEKEKEEISTEKGKDKEDSPE
jgi:hypothetical protein